MEYFLRKIKPVIRQEESGGKKKNLNLRRSFNDLLDWKSTHDDTMIQFLRRLHRQAGTKAVLSGGADTDAQREEDRAKKISALLQSINTPREESTPLSKPDYDYGSIGKYLSTQFKANKFTLTETDPDLNILRQLGPLVDRLDEKKTAMKTTTTDTEKKKLQDDKNELERLFKPLVRSIQNKDVQCTYLEEKCTSPSSYRENDSYCKEEFDYDDFKDTTEFYLTECKKQDMLRNTEWRCPYQDKEPFDTCKEDALLRLQKEEVVKLRYNIPVQKGSVVMVYGAGPVGLFTAFKLAKEIPGVQVHLVEKRSEGKTFERDNVAYLRPPVGSQTNLNRTKEGQPLVTLNPEQGDINLLSDPELFDELKKEGLCYIGTKKPSYLKNVTCMDAPKTNVCVNYSDTHVCSDAYSMPINKIQRALYNVCTGDQYKGRITFHFDKTEEEDDIKKLELSATLIIGADGTNSDIRTRIRQRLGFDASDTKKESNQMSDWYGLAVNIPCDVASPSKDNTPQYLDDPQNKVRLFPSYTPEWAKKWSASTTTVQDEALLRRGYKNKLCFYMGLILNPEEYQGIVRNMSTSTKDVYEMSETTASYKLMSTINHFLEAWGVQAKPWHSNIDQYKKIKIFPFKLEANFCDARSVATSFESDKDGHKRGLEQPPMAIVGDAVAGMIFFSGEGLNKGIDMATKLVDELAMTQCPLLSNTLATALHNYTKYVYSITKNAALIANEQSTPNRPNPAISWPYMCPFLLRQSEVICDQLGKQSCRRGKPFCDEKEVEEDDYNGNPETVTTYTFNRKACLTKQQEDGIE